MEIVGIVGNVKYRGLTFDTDAAYYLPFAQEYGRRMYLIVRSSGDAAHLTEALRREIQSVDAGATLAQMATMEQALDLSVSRPRFNTLLLSLFAGIAVLLAAVGIYGLVAYQVTQRTHEIGVLMALGAAPADVMWMVLRQGAWLAAIGIVSGLSGAFVSMRLLETLLFGIATTDALTFVAASSGIMLIVLLAASVPALRATRISPALALRCQ
jgi:putative ABC transport system permease protein